MEKGYSPENELLEPESYPEMKRNIIFQTSVLGFHLSFGGVYVYTYYIYIVDIIYIVRIVDVSL